MKLGMEWGEAARATGGTLSKGSPAAPFDRVHLDSRTLPPGAVFWALKGERHDAHDHLAQALQASGWVVARGRRPRDPAPAQVLEVADTLKALQDLARHHRGRFSAKVAALTGSNGKTTAKEMLRAVCEAAGPTCATSGNLNNHVGLPLSVLELGPEHRFGVFELGASHRGEIGALTRIARPDVAVVTNVSEAHLGLFGSLQDVFEAKAELPRAVHGPAVLNLDDPRLAGLARELGDRVVGFGTSEGCRVRLDRRASGPCLVVDNECVPLDGAAAVRVNRMNAAAAAAGALALGLGTREILLGLASFTPPPMRMETRRHPSGAVVVFDAYNANPASMKAAVEAFLEEHGDRDTTLFLADMRELGEHSERLHRELGSWLAGLQVGTVLMAGPEMRPGAEALQASRPSFGVRWARDPLDLAEALRARLSPRAAVLLKGSRAMALERLLEKV